MKYKELFTSEEWLKILAMPTYVAGAVIAGDLSGLSGLMKEGKTLYQILEQTLGNPLANPLAQEVVAELITREGNASQAALTEANTSESPESTLQRFEQSLIVLDSRVEPKITYGYKEWLYTIAVATAQAAKEGGFFGIGGMAVSKLEQSVLDHLAELLDLS